jgi:hypothetical protein
MSPEWLPPTLSGHPPEVTFTAAGPRLKDIFDGSERLTTVLSPAWYIRSCFLAIRVRAAVRYAAGRGQDGASQAGTRSR